jgi:hypothetical protein
MAKGQVKVEAYAERLRLRWSYRGALSVMTWNTNFGKRVLEGAEAKFYLHILQSAVEFSREAVEFDDVEVITGDRIFDSASFEQRVLLWHPCLGALLKPEVPVPALTKGWQQLAHSNLATLVRTF